MTARTLLLIVALTWPTVATWYYFFYLADRPGVGIAYVGAKAIQALLPLVGWYLLGMRRTPLTRPSARALVHGVVSGGVLAAPILIGYFYWLRGSELLATAPAQIASRLEAVGANSPGGFLVVALVLSVAHSLFEEYYWRWFTFGELRQRVVPRWAVALSSVAFASHHFLVIDRFVGRENLLTATLPCGLGVAVAGAVWCLLQQRHRSMIPAWISHAMVDGAVMLVGYSILWGGAG